MLVKIMMHEYLDLSGLLFLRRSKLIWAEVGFSDFQSRFYEATVFSLPLLTTVLSTQLSLNPRFRWSISTLLNL